MRVHVPSGDTCISKAIQRWSLNFNWIIHSETAQIHDGTYSRLRGRSCSGQDAAVVYFRDEGMCIRVHCDRENGVKV